MVSGRGVVIQVNIVDKLNNACQTNTTKTSIKFTQGQHSVSSIRAPTMNFSLPLGFLFRQGHLQNGRKQGWPHDVIQPRTNSHDSMV